MLQGGSLLLCGCAGGDRGSGGNLSELLTPYGMAMNADVLISKVQQGTHHPRSGSCGFSAC